MSGFAAAWRLTLAPRGCLSDHQLSVLSKVRWRVNGDMVGEGERGLLHSLMSKAPR